MNRFLSLPLILMCMLGPLWPHSHAGISSVKGLDHTSCQHVHLRTGQHHHHAGARSHPRTWRETSKSEPAPEPDPLCDAVIATATDHDADAIYLADLKWTVDRSATDFPGAYAVVAWSETWIASGLATALDDRFRRPPQRPLRLPVYLLMSSLLI